MSLLIINQLGQGTYDTVYHVKNINDGNEYALKVIKPDKDVKNIYNLTYFKELDILRRIDHPNILNCIDCYFEDPTIDRKINNNTKDDFNIYLLLPLAKNNLSDEIFNVDLFPLETNIRFMFEILSAVKMLADHRIFHLDIKPENILLFGDNRAIY